MPECAGRVAFVTLGCKVNQTESDAIAEGLDEVVLITGGEADVIVVNTCTVTGEADHKARKAVRHALALPQSPAVVVTGCLAAVDPEGLRALGERVVVEPDKDRVSERVRSALGMRDACADGARVVSGDGRETVIARPPVRARAQLKVEDGCDAFCTYCIVPHARGVPRAVPAARVVADARRLVARETSEIVLTGINIGRYSDNGGRLTDLIAQVAATGVPRIRLSSIEPGDVDERLLAIAAETPAFCPHLHIPLQSGSDGVLRRMGRPYDTAAYSAIVKRARSVFPGIAITTDVIVGFPGETDAEFAETLAFAGEIGFARLHVFRYSARGGTPAAAMPDQVPASVKAERSAMLRALGERQALEYAVSHVGKPVELLVERTVDEPAGASHAVGLTREYVRARAASDAVPAGTLVRFTPSSIGTDGALLG